MSHKFCYGIHVYSSNIGPQTLDTTISDFQSHQPIICHSLHSLQKKIWTRAQPMLQPPNLLSSMSENFISMEIALSYPAAWSIPSGLALFCLAVFSGSEVENEADICHRSSQHCYIKSTRGIQLSMTSISTSRIPFAMVSSPM